MADSLDPIAVRIQHKGCEVVRMVLGAQAGFTTALTTANKRGSVKRSHCLAIRSTETYMHTATGHRIASFQRDRELNAKGASHGAIVGAALLKVHDTDDAKGSEYSVVEATASLQILYPERNVIEHASLFSLRAV